MTDMVIIGAGVVGTAAAMMLSRYQGSIVVIEREEDVCCGTSKANSAIIHAGFDAELGTLKARFNVEGNAMMDELAEKLDFPFRRCGALVVRTRQEDPGKLRELYQRGLENGVPDLELIDRKRLSEMEEHLSDEVEEALWAPTSGIVCPFNMTIAFAENAADNGATFRFNTEVLDIIKTDRGYLVKTSGGDVETRAVVNCAGVYADVFHNMVSRKKLHITPRRGQYCLMDKNAGQYVAHTVFQLPSKMGKGVLVTPTVHGNLLVGPTAENVSDKEAVNTTAEGLGNLTATASRSVKDIPFRQVITSFAGLRAHEDGGDFIIGEAADAPCFFDAAGIESPGLSSAPAIAGALADEISRKLKLEKKRNPVEERKGIIRPNELSLKERQELIRKNPAYGHIVCRCEYVTEGEIQDAVKRTLGARSLDGIKRRTRAGMGRCQAGFCTPKTMTILAENLPESMMKVTKSGRGSELLTDSRTAEVEP